MSGFHRQIGRALRAGGATEVNGLILVVRTTTASESFTIPCDDVGVFDAVINWGDGDQSTVTTWNSANLAHVYPTAGDHEILITGLFPSIGFYNSGDKSKLIEIKSAGSVPHPFLFINLYGCTNLTKLGMIDTSAVVGFQNFLRGQIALTEFAPIDLSGSQNFYYLLSGGATIATFANFPPGMFNHLTTPASNCLNLAFNNCRLTAQSVENVLTSVDASGANAPAVGPLITIRVALNYAETATITAAKASLALKGWTFSGF